LPPCVVRHSEKLGVTVSCGDVERQRIERGFHPLQTSKPDSPGEDIASGVHAGREFSHSNRANKELFRKQIDIDIRQVNNNAGI